MKVQRPRATRYVFVAAAVLTDLESGEQSQGSTWDLSLFGCQVMPGTSARIGAKVRVQIVHGGATFEALGRVTNVRPLMGAGVAFTKIEEKHQLVLDQWLAAARNNGHNGDKSPTG